MIKRRNLLCIKKIRDIDLGNLLLYKPYKNILTNFANLIIDKNALEFDPVSRVFDGLESISDDLKYYYEAFLGITSYYQHSKGGRGKYIEKKIASVIDTCSLSIKISDIPLWLTYPDLHKKKGIFTESELSQEERRVLRESEWSWLGNTDEVLDVGNFLKNELSLVFIELKNRVDSGGTSGRREIWNSKFKNILSHFIDGTPLFSYKNKKLSFYDIFKKFEIKQIELYVGILFNVTGEPATKGGDKEQGFFSSNKEGFKDLLNYIKRNTSTFSVIEENEDDLIIKLSLKDRDFNIVIGPAYGNQIPQKLFHKTYSITDLLLLKYDDIWLSQLLAIDERVFLLKFNKNYTTIIKELLKRDIELRKLYNQFIDSEGELDFVNKIIQFILKKYIAQFEDDLKPLNREKDSYIADIIQFLAAVDA